MRNVRDAQRDFGTPRRQPLVPGPSASDRSASLLRGRRYASPQRKWRGSSKRSPHLRVPRVWGATAMVLAEFLAVLDAIDAARDCDRDMPGDSV